MDPTKTTQARNFDGNLSTARLSNKLNSYSTIEKKFKDNIVYTPPQDLTGLPFQRQPSYHGHTKKTSDEQKNNTKTAFKTKTSVKL